MPNKNSIFFGPGGAQRPRPEKPKPKPAPSLIKWGPEAKVGYGACKKQLGKDWETKAPGRPDALITKENSCVIRVFADRLADVGQGTSWGPGEDTAAICCPEKSNWAVIKGDKEVNCCTGMPPNPYEHGQETWSAIHACRSGGMGENSWGGGTQEGDSGELFNGTGVYFTPNYAQKALDSYTHVASAFESDAAGLDLGDEPAEGDDGAAAAADVVGIAAGSEVHHPLL